mmetsp:Transcript_11822/g.14743  ORF Transcript_11822/g.14743 Transcript_11822/m.14743 type:complete len:116 (-) Transcript_11822:787-1134(-)
MRLLTAIIVLLSSAAKSTAFTINAPSAINQSLERHNHRYNHNTKTLFATVPEPKTTPCDIPEGIESPTSLLSQPKSGKFLRSLTVTDVNGNRTPLSDPMGPNDGTSVVIFLRHMG